MRTVNVKEIAHDWKVKEKKRVGFINYYLLVDKNSKNIFKLVKESKDPIEHFSGRIVEIEDIEKKFEVERSKVLPDNRVVSEMIKVPYVHKLWDYAECGEEEMEQIFGKEYEYIKLVLKSNQDIFEFIFYKSNKKKDNSLKQKKGVE